MYSGRFSREYGENVVRRIEIEGEGSFCILVFGVQGSEIGGGQ